MLSACRDGGEIHYEQARRLQADLIAKGERPSSPAYDAVLAELEKVPTSSKRSDDALRLKSAIETVRGPVRRALAVFHKDESSLPPEVAAQSRACARLAELSGRDGGATEAAIKALDDCRKRVDALDEAAAHREEPQSPAPH